MKMPAAIAALVLVTALPARAHQLDELLQATRVEVTPRQIAVHVSLTPGVAVADRVLALLDRDGDGRVLPLEAEAYGRDLLRDLTASLDDRIVTLELVRVEVPPPDALRDGEGTIRVDARAAALLTPGRHAIEVRNGHAPADSVYLANALLPDDSRVRVAAQDRDPRQQRLTMTIEYAGQQTTPLGWIVAAAALLLAHARWRRTGSAGAMLEA